MRAILFIAPLLILTNAVLIGPSTRPARIEQRFSGALVAVADLLWLKSAQQIVLMERVSNREAEANDRLIRTAIRLNPTAREPYRFGPIGLLGWSRPDLALALARDGVARFPGDHDLERTLGLVLVLADDAIQPEDFRRALETGAGASPTARRLLGILRATKEEEWGNAAKAIEAWREIEATTDEPALRERARRAIERLHGSTSAKGVS
jgi:hypothetical protein